MENTILYRFTKMEYFIEMLKDIRYEKSPEHKDKSLDDFYLPLRLYPFRHMSDKTDGMWGMYLIMLALDRYAQENNLPNKTYDFVSSFFKLYDRNEDYIYISSWTTDANDEMWKTFGDDGKGVMFSMLSSKLCKCRNIENKSVEINYCKYLNVDDFVEQNNDAIGSLYDMVIDDSPKASAVKIDEMCKWMKYEGLSKENEVRIIKNVSPTFSDQIKIDKDNKRYVEILVPLTAFSQIVLGYKVDYLWIMRKIDKILCRRLGRKLKNEYMMQRRITTTIKHESI